MTSPLALRRLMISSKKLIIALIIALLILCTILLSSPGIKVYFQSNEVQRITDKHYFTEDFSCSMTPVLLGRFKSLSHQETYLFALNLHNSQDILENLLKELVVVVKLLGLNNCFIQFMNLDHLIILKICSRDLKRI